MKKIISLFLALATLCLCLVSCTGGAGNSAEPPKGNIHEEGPATAATGVEDAKIYAYLDVVSATAEEVVVNVCVKDTYKTGLKAPEGSDVAETTAPVTTAETADSASASDGSDTTAAGTTVPTTGTIVTDGPNAVGVCSVGLAVDYDSTRLVLKSGMINEAIGGLGMTSQTVSVKPYMVYWVGGICTLPYEDNVLATLTFVPTEALTDTAPIWLAIDENNPFCNISDEPMSGYFVLHSKDTPLSVSVNKD